MPRIAHVISTVSLLGGAERVLAALVAGGADRGWEQVVLNPFAGDAHHAPLAAACEPATYVGRPCAHLSELPGTRRWLGHRLAELEPEIVHAHLFHALLMTASVRRRPGSAWILTHHHTDSLNFERRRSEAFLDRRAGRRFDRVVAVSEWSRQVLLSRYGYPPAKVVCIPNGWDGDPRPHGPANAPTVVCVANFRKQKGHDTLIAAFAKVVKAIPDARLLLVGDGELHEALERRVSSLGLRQSVRFTNAVSDIWPYLAEAHVFALASEYEPLGIAVMEAMAAGLPVVATAVGGIPELVAPSVTGELVPPGDADALAGQLLKLLASPELQGKMGAAARVAASQRRMADCVAGYFDLYDRVINESPRLKAAV